MSMVKWNPITELQGLQKQMAQKLTESRGRAAAEPEEQVAWQPLADIYEDAHSLVIKLELPEVARKDIRVHIAGQTLIVEGERPLASGGGRVYHRVERQYGSFRRSFALSAPLRHEDIHISYRSGILKLMLPKPSGEAGQ